MPVPLTAMPAVSELVLPSPETMSYVLATYPVAPAISVTVPPGAYRAIGVVPAPGSGVVCGTRTTLPSVEMLTLLVAVPLGVGPTAPAVSVNVEVAVLLT